MTENNMTEKEMWEAVISNNAEYDGLFFYGVKSTGIYCRPSCKSKVPKKENVLFFNNSKEAINQGFRPCKRCRSDLLDYKPIKEIASELKRLIDHLWKENIDFKESLKNFGMSNHRMVEIFKEEYGISLFDYAANLKIDYAKEKLEKTDMDIIDIAYEIGFSGLSSFYQFFKKKTGYTPAAYRKEHR